MEELINRVASAAEIPQDQAERAAAFILAFLKKEAPVETEELFQELPGSEEAAVRGEADKPNGGGLLGGLTGMMSGAGGVMGLAAKLTALGLDTTQMQSIGKEIFAVAREKAGDERVNQVASAIPGLQQLL